MKAVYRVMVALVLFAGSVGLAAGFYVGDKQAAARGETEAVSRAARDARIMEIVVERNPDATIRDFAGFPEALVRISAGAGLDYRLVLAVIDKESGFRPGAVGAAGEVGLMQVMPATAAVVARDLGMVFEPPTRGGKGHPASLGTLGVPAENVRIGVAYLRRQLTRYALLPVALRGYNRHPDRALERRPGDRYAEDVALAFLVLTQRLP